jgi:demethylmacrocin O-methyltransferase
MLSVIIPARNEQYLEKTIRNVLENAEGEIEIIAELDGYRPDPQINIGDNRVLFVYHEKRIGQRGCINHGASIAKGKYIMKLDAHCSVAKGFDVILARDCEPEWTMIPRMYNLDVATWKPKMHKLTDYMYITSPQADKPFRAMYYSGNEYYRQHSSKEEIDDTMCCMGPCFFMHKERFLAQGGCDEGHGGWGQQGVEVSLKAWLSGGALKVNKKTWFAHWFRGGGGPGFPYKISGNDQQRARKYSQDLWLNDKWNKATRKLEWVTRKFNPPGWNNDLTILFYTANRVSDKILNPVARSLKKHGYPIVSVSQEPMDLGKNIVVPKKYSIQNVYRQVLTAAYEARTKYVALCEDDCLYTKEHFQFRPEKSFGYNLNRWMLHLDEALYSYRKRPILSQCIAKREDLIKNLEERNKLPKIYDKYCGEMGVFDKELGIPEFEWETFEAPNPNLVICHDKSVVGRKYFGKDANPRKELAPWGKVDYWMDKLTNRKRLRQHSHIKSIIFDMDELWENIIEYRDRRRPIERAIRRVETMPPFIRRVLKGEEFTDEQLQEFSYYKTVRSHGNGHKKTIWLMRDLISLVHSIKKEGVRNPIDMWQADGNLVIHRGWRRITIMRELGYKKVPCRVFESREMFIKLYPNKDLRPDNSINGIAMKQYIDLREKATDKYWVHQYTPLYDRHLGHLRDNKIKLLEIGVFRGASLDLWQRAFPKGQIYGVDITDKWKELTPKKAKVFMGRQEDEKFMKEKVMPHGKFDVIIDDGGHKPGQMQASLLMMWENLNENGFYVIEDLYGNYRRDRIKNTTMNVLKELIDRMNIACEIKAMHFYYNICFIQKAQGV